MAEEEEITIQLTLTAVEGSPRVPLKIKTNATADDLLKAVTTATKIPTAKVIFRGRLIKSSTDTLAVPEYKLEDGSVLHCMGKPVTNEESTATASSATTPTPASLSGVSFQGPGTSAAATAAPTTTTSSHPLDAALAHMRSQLTPSVYTTAVTTLHKLLTNITEHPLEQKYRRIKKGNAAFNKRLGGLAGAREAILACGFTEDATENTYELQASADAWPALLETVRKVEAAVRATSSGAPLPGAMLGAGLPGMNPMNATMGMMPNAAGAGGFPGMPPNMNNPQMQQAVQALLSNPAQLQQMLQDPMVQTMMQNDPMGQQAMQQMQNMTPQQLAQMSQMFAAASAAGGAPNMFGGGGAPNMFGGAAAAPSGAAAAAPGATDSTQTEEDMIAEAIRRSLDDQSNNNNNNNGSS